MKRVLCVVLLLSASLAATCWLVTSAQAPPANAGGTDKSAAPSPTPAATPALKTEDLLKVRDLQYQQAKRLLQMRQMEKEYKALQDAVDAVQRQMDEVIRAGAKAGNIDLDKWTFDPDALRFVARPTPSPEKK